ncbi:MAG: hypothetical protein IKU45_02340 [Clostridia bacterium]|nr:hypothetical protein [Clostridia bacterium]
MASFKRISAYLLSVILFVCILSLTPTANNGDLGIPFDKDLYYGRSVLEKMSNSQNLIAAYDEIVKGIQDSKVDIPLEPLGIHVTEKEIDLILAIYRFDNPHVFWVEKYQYYTADTAGGYSWGAHIVYNALDSDEARNKFDYLTKVFLDSCGIEDSMSEYEISKILHDKIAEHITYKNTNNANSVWGALVEGECVCEGYAELYQYLLYLNGISAHIVTGTSNGIPHAWNVVRIDGKYYQTDVTWDDRASGTVYDYFNITDEQMQNDHVYTYNGYPLPECNSVYSEEIIVGDVDGNGKVNNRDAVYLLYCILYPESYTTKQNCDYNQDSIVTQDDAVYLLYHVIFGETYPLPTFF